VYSFCGNPFQEGSSSPSLSLLVIVSRKDRKEEKKGRGKEGRDVKREEGRDVKSGSLVLLSLPPTVVYFPPSSLTLFVFERERKRERTAVGLKFVVVSVRGV
jgi:hypothetical protein